MGYDFDDIVDTIAYAKIAPSPIHGYGLFATEPLSAAVCLAYLDGQVIPWALYQRLPLCDEWNALNPETLMVRPYRTKYGFINHARTPNLQLKSVESQLALFTRQGIATGEEFTLNYLDEPLPPEYVQSPGKDFL